MFYCHDHTMTSNIPINIARSMSTGIKIGIVRITILTWELAPRSHCHKRHDSIPSLRYPQWHSAWRHQSPAFCTAPHTHSVEYDIHPAWSLILHLKRNTSNNAHTGYRKYNCLQKIPLTRTACCAQWIYMKGKQNDSKDQLQYQESILAMVITIAVDVLVFIL